MIFVDSAAIINFFSLLNNSGIDYILLRNINNELPEKLEVKKDIDVLFKINDRDKILFLLKNNGFKPISHPFEKDIFLYGVTKFEKVINDKNVLIDLNYELTCRSLNAGEWLPLDNKIQQSAWDNKIFVEKYDFKYWSLSHNDEFISLVTRCVFDRKEFEKGYTNRIIELLDIINKEEVLPKLQLIFYKFVPELMAQLNNKTFEKIIEKYIAFIDY